MRGTRRSFAAPRTDAAGNVTGTTIKYNPDVAIMVHDMGGDLIDEPPQIILGHELIHGVHFVEGTNQSGVDPDPPASQPSIRREESYTIGVGSHAADTLTENQLRSEFGLPDRRDHFGYPGIEMTTKKILWFEFEVQDRTNELKSPTGDMRPGACEC